MVRVGSFIFAMVAVAGLPVAAWAQAAEMPASAACTAPASLPPGLAAWNALRVTVNAATLSEEAGKAGIKAGNAAKAVLSPESSVRYASKPAKTGGADSYGGLLSVEIPESGNYRIALDGSAWVDVIEQGKPVASIAHGHGPACSGIAKIVDFKLDAGRHLLQISASMAKARTVMVSRLP